MANKKFNKSRSADWHIKFVDKCTQHSHIDRMNEFLLRCWRSIRSAHVISIFERKYLAPKWSLSIYWPTFVSVLVADGWRRSESRSRRKIDHDSCVGGVKEILTITKLISLGYNQHCLTIPYYRKSYERRTKLMRRGSRGGRRQVLLDFGGNLQVKLMRNTCRYQTHPSLHLWFHY